MKRKRNQGRSSQNKSRRKNEFRPRLIYVGSILALAALVGVAFFSPGWVFGFQDNIRCSDTVLEDRENADVAVLSTNYESSFYQRMINFAENQDGNTNYYVASEELTNNAQLQEFLYSDMGLYSERIWTLIDTGLISDQIFQCQVSAWKQYVIYSDDYARGVNFILWYIELEHSDESIGTYKLLMEAETGELYGLQADTGGGSIGKTLYSDKYSDRDEYQYSLEEYLNIMAGFILNEDGWATLAYFYSGLTESDFFQYYELYYSAYEAIYDATPTNGFNSAVINVNDEALSELRLKLGIADDRENQWFDFLRIRPAMLVWDGGNRLEYTFPYGEGRMIFRMQMAESVPYSWELRNITVGFPAIYELIPEFN